MWRSIASRSSLTRHLGRNLLSSQQTQQSSLSSSSIQVLHKTLNQSHHFTNPRTFIHQNVRFMSQSSISEFDNDAHDPTSSSEEENGGVFDLTHDVGSSQDHVLRPGIDENGENNDAQMSGFSSSGQEFDGSVSGVSVEKLGNLTHDAGFSKESVLMDGIDGNGEISDAQMGGLSSIDQDLDGSVVFDVEKLENVLSLLQSSVDESLESRLDGLGLDLSEEFVVRVIETPLVPAESLIRFFKWGKERKELTVNTSVLGGLVSAVCNDPKRLDAYALWDLVKEIGEEEKGVVNAEILNQLISMFSKLGKGKAVFEVFGKFDELECVRNADTFYLTIQGLCKRSFYDWAISVSQKMLGAGMFPESEKVGEIISLFCEGRKEKEAYAVYLAAKEKMKYPPQRTVNFLISCLSKVDETVPFAQEMLVGFPAEVRKGAINPFSWVIRGLCRKKETDGAKKLLLEMIEKGPPPGNGVFNSIINSLSKAGDLEDAKEMLRLMESRGLKPDVYSYSVIISSYAKGGLMEEARKVLSEAKKKHQKLSPVTFHTLIRGYCKLGEFDKALKLLSEMKDYGVEANVDEYNKLIQSLCLNALDWQTAEKLLDEMKGKGLHLPGITRGLIRAVKELDQEVVVSEEAAVAKS